MTWVFAMAMIAADARANLGLRDGWTSPSAITVTFVSESHKQKTDGDVVGVWSFRFDKAGAPSVETRIIGTLPDAEIAAHGHLYLIHQTKVAERVRVEELALPQKLTDDEALALAERLAKDVPHNRSGTSEQYGIYEVTLATAAGNVFVARIGAFTRRILAATRL
jgi:hypothetical protein